MKRILKIVGRISDKGGRAKTFSLVLCSFIVLLLVASVYGVFGEGITGAAVAGSSGEPSGAVVNPDGSAVWEKSGIGLLEWDKFNTQSCSATRYLNITSYLTSQDLDVCVKTERPLANSRSDAWIFRGMSNPVYEQVWVNTTLCDVNVSGCVEEGYYNPNYTGENWYPNWFNIKDKFTHYSYNGDEFYCLKNVYVKQNQKYELKLDMAFSLKRLSDGGFGCDEKFGLVVKRSSESLQDAVSLNHFVELDPIYSNNETVIAWWKFDGNLLDSAAESNQAGSQDWLVSSGTGAYNTTGECKSGTCLRLLKDGYTLFYGDANNLFVQQSDWSWCSYINFGAANPSPYFFGKTYSMISAEMNFLTNCYDTPGAEPYGILSNSVGGWLNIGGNASSCPDRHTWAYFCMIWDGDSNSSEWNINGVWSGSHTVASSFKVVGINDTLWFGSHIMANPPMTSFFDGSVDNMIFFNTSITLEDIQTFMSNNGDLLTANIAPSNPVVSLSPYPTAGPDFDLSCTFTPVDPDNETLTAYVIWNNHSVEAPEHSSSKQVNNDTDPESFVLDDAYTTIGDKWKCGVKACDHAACSDWSNSSETEIVSIANKTDFTTGIGNIQSNNVKNVYVYDASKESWNRTADENEDSWYKVTTRESFPDKVYLLLTDTGLDIVDASDTDMSWMYFTSGSSNAIDGNDFTSVYALDGKIYVGSDKGFYVLDFANDNISKYNSSGLAYYDTDYPFHDLYRNNGYGYTFSESTPNGNTLKSNIVNDINANRVRGNHLVTVATDGDANGNGAVMIFNMDNGDIAEVDFCEDQNPENYDSDNVFIADDGTLYFSENNINKETGKTKLSYKYNIDVYNGTSGRAEGYDGSVKVPDRCNKAGYRSKDFAVRSTSYPHFLSEKINNVYVTSETSRRHVGHNTVYIATEEGVTVIQEVQDNEGRGIGKSYGYTGSTNSNMDYKVLEGSTDNVTAVTARSDGNAIYVGTNNGNGVGSVSKISLNSNSLVDYWNKETDIALVGNDTTSLDFLDGDLLVGTLNSGATQIVEQELAHYLITDYTNHRVVEIDNTGLIHWSFGVYGTAGNGTYLTNPTYAERHTDGNYLIADSGNRRILEINPDGEVIQQITNGTQLSDATSLGEVYSVQKIS